MKIFWAFLFFFILLSDSHIAENENKTNIIPQEQIIKEIGFLKISEPVRYEINDEIFFGLKMKENAYYKICNSDQESVIKAGYLNEGLNIIGLPLNQIIGENNGIFFLFLKNENTLVVNRINFNTEGNINSETGADWDESGTIHDKNRHEMTVSEVIKDDPLSSPGAGPVDPVAGNYPTMSQGIPVLPILFFLGKKLLSGKKKNREKVIVLHKTANFFLQEKKKGKKRKIENLKISIAISDI